MNYPPANVSTQADDFHGEIVADPYRALEEVPGHALKFGAALQTAQQGQAPILVRLESALSEKPLEIRGR